MCPLSSSFPTALICLWMAVKGTGMLKTRKAARGPELLIPESQGLASGERSRLLPWSSADQRGKNQEPGSELSMRLVGRRGAGHWDPQKLNWVVFIPCQT